MKEALERRQYRGSLGADARREEVGSAKLQQREGKRGDSEQRNQSRAVRGCGNGPDVSTLRVPPLTHKRAKESVPEDKLQHFVFVFSDWALLPD